MGIFNIIAEAHVANIAMKEIIFSSNTTQTATVAMKLSPFSVIKHVADRTKILSKLSLT